MKKIKNYRCDCGIYFDSSADFEDMKILCPDCYTSLHQVETVDIKILEKFKSLPNDHIEGFKFYFSNMQYLQSNNCNIGIQFKSHCGIIVSIYVNNTIYVCGWDRETLKFEVLRQTNKKALIHVSCFQASRRLS